VKLFDDALKRPEAPDLCQKINQTRLQFSTKLQYRIFLVGEKTAAAKGKPFAPPRKTSIHHRRLS
jgi:hypothetical protein